MAAESDQPTRADQLADRGLLRLEFIPRKDKLLQAAHESIDRIAEQKASSSGSNASDSQRLIESLRMLDAYYLLIKASECDRVGFESHCRSVLEQLSNSDPPPQLRQRLQWRRSRLGQFENLGELEAAKNLAIAISAKLPSEKAPPPTPPTCIDKSEHGVMSKGFRRLEYGDGRSLYMEEGFAEEMLRSWNEPLLTTTAHAVETLHMLARREARIAIDWRASGEDSKRPVRAPGYKVDDHVLRFAASCFRPELGLFRDPNSEQLLYATSSGIAIFKAHFDIACSERADRAQLREIFQRLDGAGKMVPIDHARVRDAAVGSLARILTDNSSRGVANNAIIEINHALRIIWNLSADLSDGGESIIAELRPKLTSYLLRCHRRTRFALNASSPELEFDTFVMSPTSEAACLTACLAVLRIAEHAELENPDLDAKLAACGRYVAACRREGSGFGSSIRHTPDLLHTYMALAARARAMEKAEVDVTWKQALEDWDFIDDGVERDLIRFLDLCRKDDGGYALIPEWMGSAYGTRLAFQSLARMDLPIVGTWKMRNFITNLLEKRPDGTAGYVGYSAAATFS